MWVWQSHAPAGISKFTGVAGWAALARTVRSFMITPGCNRGKRDSGASASISPLLRWCVRKILLRRRSRACARRGGWCPRRACGDEPDQSAGQRAGGKEIQTGLETAGRVLDPADDEGAKIAAEVAGGVDQGDRARRRRAGEEDRRHRPERRARAG